MWFSFPAQRPKHTRVCSSGRSKNEYKLKISTKPVATVKRQREAALLSHYVISGGERTPSLLLAACKHLYVPMYLCAPHTTQIKMDAMCIYIHARLRPGCCLRAPMFYFADCAIILYFACLRKRVCVYVCVYTFRAHLVNSIFCFLSARRAGFLSLPLSLCLGDV